MPGTTITVYRAVGPDELRLVAESDWRRFPPRSPEQPIFWLVDDERYAARCAHDWNGPSDGEGHVLRFWIDREFMERYPAQQVAGGIYRERRIPAEDVDELNSRIDGLIKLGQSYYKGMLGVTSVDDAAAQPCNVEIDVYTPIKFTSYSETPPGVRYVHVRNSNNAILDFKFGPESLALRGFTLVMGDCATRDALTGNGPVVEGLPTIRVPGEEVIWHGVVPQVKVEATVSLSYRHGRAEITLGDSTTFNSTIAHGRVHFLLSNSVLVGMRVIDLTRNERNILRDYVEEHRRQTVAQ